MSGVNQTGRTSSKRPTKNNKINGQFAWRTIDMLRSPAFGVLSLAARRILDRLEIELADHGGKDNGALICTFDDFERFGISRDGIGPGMRELVALGFVVIEVQGLSGNGEHRTPSKYRLTYRHTEYADPTDDWRKIQSDDEARSLRAAARKKKPEKNKFPVRKNQLKPVPKNQPKSHNSQSRKANYRPGGDSPLLSIYPRDPDQSEETHEKQGGAKLARPGVGK